MTEYNGENLTLREYIDLRIEGLEKEICLKFRANKDALELADKVLSAHLEQLNEWKKYSEGRDAAFFTVKEHEAYKAIINLRIKPLENMKLLLEDRATQKDVSTAKLIGYIGIILGIIGTIAGLVK